MKVLPEAFNIHYVELSLPDSLQRFTNLCRRAGNRYVTVMLYPPFLSRAFLSCFLKVDVEKTDDHLVRLVEMIEERLAIEDELLSCCLPAFGVAEGTELLLRSVLFYSLRGLYLIDEPVVYRTFRAGKVRGELPAMIVTRKRAGSVEVFEVPSVRFLEAQIGKSRKKVFFDGAGLKGKVLEVRKQIEEGNFLGDMLCFLHEDGRWIPVSELTPFSSVELLLGQKLL